MSDAFLDFAQAADAVRELRGTKRKVARVAEHLAAVPPEALADAAVLWTGRPFARADERVLSVGWATLRDAVLALVPWDAAVYAACHRAVGDTGETVGKLFELEPPRRRGQRRLGEDEERPPLTLGGARGVYAALAAARGADAKRRILEDALLACAPVEAKYLLKIVTNGMRIGLQESLVEEAVAQAFARPLEDVRTANMLVGDVGLAATLAREGRLADARFRPFHPIQFMLAGPLEAAAALDADELPALVAEDKLDGVRAQIHKAGDRAVVYTRTLDEAREFPEIVAAARAQAGSFVLDGEIVAVRPEDSSRVAPFGRLQRRLGRKEPDAALVAEIPVRFVAYDVLWADGVEWWREPFEARRRALESLGLGEPLRVSPLREVASVADVEAAFAAARARGNEGLMLKRRDAPYEFGKRGRRWRKLKAAFATLDVVVTAAEHGQGKRAGLLSDYTFAVRGPDGSLLNVGKAYIGVTDEEIRELTARFRRITVERYGSVHLVRPEVVLEVAFDSVQASARHKSGYALRFPRIVRIRRDKRPEDADTLARVAELAKLSLEGAPSGTPSEA